MFDWILDIPLQFLIINSVMLILIIVLIILTISNRMKLKKLKNKYYRFMHGITGSNIEELLEETLEKVKGTIDKNKEIESHLNDIDRNLLICMQKVGVVRFNAFDDVGSDLSFSVALLDNNDNGVVISSLYSRDSSATYAKPLSGGKSRYALSVEELKAIDVAKKVNRQDKTNANK
jgi:hypothetical protein